MDYPDEDELYELEYQEELEMMDDLPGTESNYEPKTAAMKVSSTPNVLKTPALPKPSPSESLFSVQMSQIDGVEGTQGGPINRRLFGTPQGGKRVSSTPIAVNQRGLLPAIPEAADLCVLQEENTEDDEPALDPIRLRSKRRLERDLFGDIDDLYGCVSYEDPASKKARTEEERDLEMIERIIDARRLQNEAIKSYRTKNSLERLQAIHDFKIRNLSYAVPKWPFMPLRRSNDDRLYVRFHSEDYETKAIEDLSAQSSGLVGDAAGLLGARKQQVWAAASEIVLRRSLLKEPSTSEPPSADGAAAAAEKDTPLWVEKYKPRKYVDLLSDESTNRSLLYWLKMWDKPVFGREFKLLREEVDPKIKMNTFNKRTQKFESNGGWRPRKTRQALNENVDEHGRPMQKVALLCGPPGLGKTTLAHTIARHAGYEVREVNASDDRTPEAFRQALENGTQMSSVLNVDSRPNCIILDEIDGAPRQSIEFLVKFVSDAVAVKGRANRSKAKHNILKRPIICICNDLYAPALRPLRLVAFVVAFPPIESARLADRLLLIARRERLKSDFGALIALAEKSGNDVRSCISTMEFFNAQKKALTLHDVLSSAVGNKDRHLGLFDVWQAVFTIKRPKKQLERSDDATNAGVPRSGGGAVEADQPHIILTDMSASTRAQSVLDAVHSEGGDYEILTQGVYENFLHQKMPDPNLNGVVQAAQWFCFTDTLQCQIRHLQNYTVYPYLQFGFVVWHLLFASLAWPKLSFPTRGFEFTQKCATQRSVFQALRKGVAASGCVAGVGVGHALLVDTVPLLKRILSPTLRSVAIQLLSPKEQRDLKHVIAVMVDLGLHYIQVKSAGGFGGVTAVTGAYVFQLEPDLELLMQFPGFPAGLSLTYFGRQLISREVELEVIRRATPRAAGEDSKSASDSKSGQKQPQPARVPNHLRTLQPKAISKKDLAKEKVKKDFFGRIVHASATRSTATEAKTDAIVKSPIWYRFKEGYNNAVRKDLHMNELL